MARFWGRIELATRLAILAFVLAAFAPTEPVANPPGPADEPPALRTFLETYISQSGHDLQPGRFSLAAVDLNQDGTREVIAYISGGEWCGSGGCTMLVLEPNGSTFKIIGKTAITQLPIRELGTRHHGWHDIGVFVAGGGIEHGYEAALPFDGRRYAGNPSAPPAHPVRGHAAGKVLISREAVQEHRASQRY